MEDLTISAHEGALGGKGMVELMWRMVKIVHVHWVLVNQVVLLPWRDPNTEHGSVGMKRGFC